MYKKGENMGNLRKMVSNTVEKAKKLTTNLIDSAKETARQKKEADRKRREEKERHFKETFPYQYMLTIREKNIFSSKESGLWEQITSDSYVITDADEKPVYIAKESLLVGSYKYTVTDSDKKVIGHIRRHLFNFGFPFVKDRHGCTVRVAKNNERYRLTTHMFLNEREFGGLYSTYSVRCKDKKEFPKEFMILKGNKEIAHIYSLSSDDGFLASRYIIGYNDKNNEILTVLNSLAIHLVIMVS